MKNFTIMKTKCFSGKVNGKGFKKLLAFTTILFFAFTSINAADYYWVNGTGNWSDYANHWATASGGTTFHTAPPSPLDNVYFDHSSFLDSDTVIMDQVTMYCNDMLWSDSLPHTITILQSAGLPSPTIIKVYGSMILSDSCKWASQYLLCEFNSNNTGNIINTKDIKTGKVIFNGNGNWTLAGRCRVGDIDFLSGKLIIRTDYFSCGSFTPHGSNLFLDGGYSILHATTWNEQFAAYSQHDMQNVTLYLYQNGSGTFYSSNDTTPFGDVIFLERANIQSPDSSHFNKIIAYGNLTITNGSLVLDTLAMLTANTTLKIKAGKQQRVNNQFVMGGTLNAPILFQSSLTGSAATLNMPSGTICLHYVYLNDISATGGAQFYAGQGCIDLGGNTGWTFAPCSVVSDVWPGDANYDLIANNFDLLNIGIAYGDTGSMRANASINYVVQPCVDWANFFQSAVNHKHADCNGDGVVNALDTLAVSQNYGLIHPRPVNQDSASIITGAPLYFDLPAGNLTPGSNVSVPLDFGTGINPVNDLYGMAFTINYDPSLIQSGSVSIDYNGSWLATPPDYIHLEKDFSANGNLDMAVCRINHQNISGNGMIATLHFTVAANAAGPLTLSFSNIKAISNNELQLTVNAQSGSVPTGISETLSNAEFVFYPNPVHDYINVSFNNNAEMKFEIVNAFGQIISATVSRTNRISTANLPAGVYLLRGFSAKSGKMIEKRFVKE